jgi:putative ABC transport system permease protein
MAQLALCFNKYSRIGNRHDLCASCHLYVKDELNFDQFHKNKHQLYRLNTTITGPQDGTKQTLGTTGQIQGPAFKNAIPEIEDYTRILGMDNINLTGNGKSLAVKNLFADKNFFDLFSFPLIYGNPQTVLNDPFSIVLSETTAKKFFGTTNVVGKTLKIEEGRGIENLSIAGVTKDALPNSSIQFDVLVPFSYFQLMFINNNWLNQYLTTFILLHPLAKPEIVSGKFSEVFGVEVKQQLSDTKSAAQQYQFSLSPLPSMHLNPMGQNPNGSADEERGLSKESTITYSYILIDIVVFILLMASVNFINLSIANSLKGAKEIGVRKIAGSSSTQIILQFLIEAAILCFISFAFAIAVSNLLLPVFNQFANKKISISYADADLFIYGAGLMILCILISGLYPAITLSLFNPAEVLYGRQKMSNKNLFRKILIAGQFSLAIGLIIATIVYYNQMNFISKSNLGYDDTNIIKMHLPPQRLNEDIIRIFRNRLLDNSTIKSVTTNMDIGTTSVAVDAKTITAKTNTVDEYYLPTFAIPLKEGRNFSKTFGTDSANAVIVNETFVKSAGWESGLGRQVKDLNDNHLSTIIGVVKNYHYGSLKEIIGPEILRMGNRENIFIKADKTKILQALSITQKIYKQIFPDHNFQYQFLDTENANVYENDKRWQDIITYASILACLICGIGLFGLSHFSAQQRKKEIGIRKVLGASVTGIFTMLSKDFLKLAFIAVIVASPVAYYFMNRWLENFAYRINISWLVFLMAGMFSITIVLITVGFQAIKAAIANPMKSLRTELTKSCF